MGTVCKLDQIDLKILSRLQADGRLQNNQLAEAVGLSASPCLQRVRRLEKQGVKFHAGTDYGPFVRRMKAIYEPLWAAKDPVSVQALAMILNAMAGR